ncbi:hypothetical protein CQA62_00885 [Helicobacter cholecystus]|uniref:Uncharacterized protein n=1 Tax=Helicobacter cholecystus TaxID=45498 RepID=A0A3D8IXI8_9HELI|nr:hypothetical protein [Helicobacter cholecystus]RDU69999.1 hypothetical protein CQA62_00885 [Helicobacter cholecystus]VEJ24831.1 integral membrane protein [Helicobacter cholecystus]
MQKSMSERKANIYFFLIVCLDALMLCLMIDEISISYKEALIYFSQNTVAGNIAYLSTQIFGRNDFGLRLPFLLTHLCNLYLLYEICKYYLKHPIDRLLCVGIFALLPGINLISIFVHKSVFVLFLTLLLCFLHIKRYRILFYPLCATASFLDPAFSIIFLALFLYSLKHKHNKTLFFSLFCFSANMYLFNLHIKGIPQGHFLDTLGLLSLLYSPMLFVYFFYTLYHSLLRKEHSFILYVSATSIVFTIVLSLRQEIDLYTFLPLSAVGLPVMIKVFMHDLRIRLKPFRISYLRRFYFIIIPLLLEISLLFCNKIFFLFDKHHFLDNFYYSKEIAKELKAKNIYAIKTHAKLALPLKFYGISPFSPLSLIPKENGSIKVEYLHRNIREYEITGL